MLESKKLDWEKAASGKVGIKNNEIKRIRKMMIKDKILAGIKKLLDTKIPHFHKKSNSPRKLKSYILKLYAEFIY